MVVTGGGGGLGAAHARRFARAGARLALLDLDEAAAGRTAGELEARGAEALALACDVADADDRGARGARGLGGGARASRRVAVDPELGEARRRFEEMGLRERVQAVDEELGT